MFFFSRSAVDILISHHHGKHLLASASSHELHEYECMLDPMMIWSVAKTCRERDCNRYELILLVRDSRQWLTDCCASKQGPISTWPLSTMEKNTLFFSLAACTVHIWSTFTFSLHRCGNCTWGHCQVACDSPLYENSLVHPLQMQTYGITILKPKQLQTR